MDDIEDTREDNREMIDEDEILSEIYDCLTVEQIKFLQDKFNQQYRETTRWQDQARLQRAEIERRDARIAELEAQLAAERWISVEDRLPEMMQTVLVSDGHSVCEGRRSYHFNNSGYVWVQIDYMILRGVTHWMELPPPPDLR